MICEKCKKDFKESEIHEHHIIPKYFEINKLYSSNQLDVNRTIRLCERCHNIIHKLILIPLWRFVPVEWKPCSWQTKRNCCYSLFNFTLKWLEEENGNS